MKTDSIVAFVGITTLALDQFVKLWLYSKLGSEGSISIGRFIKLFIVKNDSMALGIPIQGGTLVISVLLVLVIFMFLYVKYFRSAGNKLDVISTGLVIGGALGNVIDRIRAGGVIDYIAILNFPRFNIADIAIGLGIFLIIMQLLRDEKNSLTFSRSV